MNQTWTISKRSLSKQSNMKTVKLREDVVEQKKKSRLKQYRIKGTAAPLNIYEPRSNTMTHTNNI